MANFKVGDRVRLTDKCRYVGNPYVYKVGDIGYIVPDKYQYSLVVKMENPKNGYTHLWCNAYELEHAETSDLTITVTPELTHITIGGKRFRLVAED